MSAQVKMQKKTGADKEQSRGKERALHSVVFNFQGIALIQSYKAVVRNFSNSGVVKLTSSLSPTLQKPTWAFLHRIMFLGEC